jgi:hypothetical protein
MTAGLGASFLGLAQGSGRWWGAAGLVLTLPNVSLVGWSSPSTLAVCAAVLGIGFWARGRWCASQAALSQWRWQRDQDLQRELRRGRDV